MNGSGQGLICRLFISLAPLDTAFKQQRLKAWQPILTPRTVLPTLFIIGILFAPIGGLLIWGSSLVSLPVPLQVLYIPLTPVCAVFKVSEMDFDYTDCDQLDAQTSTDSLTFTNLPSSKFSYNLRASDSNAAYNPPSYAFVNLTGQSNVGSENATQCILQFDVPADIDHTVLLYYKLTNFFQNHRRYVKSLDQNQLRGDHVSTSTLKSGDCDPLGVIDDKAVYPCGLIANSLFNGVCFARSHIAIEWTHSPFRYIL